MWVTWWLSISGDLSQSDIHVCDSIGRGGSFLILWRKASIVVEFWKFFVVTLQHAFNSFIAMQPYSGQHLMLSSLYSLLGTTYDYDPKIKKGTIYVHSLSCIWCSDDSILFSNHYLQALYRLVKAGQGETFAVLQVSILAYHLLRSHHLSACNHLFFDTMLILLMI